MKILIRFVKVMRQHGASLLALILICLLSNLLIVCSDRVVGEREGTDDDSQVFPDTNPDIDPDILDIIDTNTTVFVLSGAGGNGSVNDPMGSIQQAIDSAAVDQSIRTIAVASGFYPGPLTITKPIIIAGSRDPENGWFIDTTNMTIIEGGLIDSTEMVVMIHDVDGVVSLQNIETQGSGNAYQGRSSHGLVANNVQSLQLYKCVIRSGRGGAGQNGAAGAIGQDGGAGHWVDPGINPVSGGQGGHENQDHQAGFCVDGTQTGGATDCYGGVDGQSGANDGNSGILAANTIRVLWNALVITVVGDSGGDGQVGESGCGGGGSAVNMFFERDYITGEWWMSYLPGGGGGAGASGGSGGLGGMPGASSVGTLFLNSDVTIANSIIESAQAGRGGDGGVGGVGGIGGAGGIGGGSFGGCGGQDGGDGGNGAPGGIGGGGAGGASIAILKYQSDITFISPNTITAGLGGAWGSGATQSNLTGLSRRIYEIDTVYTE